MSDTVASNGKYVRYELSEFAGKIKPVDHDIPVPTGTEVLLKVDFCGVCHSDVHVREGYYELGQGKKLDLGGRGIKLPVTLGHEVVGTVESVGPDAEGAAVGQQKLIYPWIGCGECSVCQRGEENLCTKPASLGVFKPGGYSEYVIIPHPRYLADLGNLNPANASLLACSGLTTYSAIKKIQPVHEEEFVVVVGCGGLGQLAVKTLVLSGIKNVIAIDVSEEKRELVKKSGARFAFDPRDEGIVDTILEATNGNCRAVLDFVGNEQTAELGLSVLMKGGRLVAVGLHGGEIRYPIPVLITKAVSIIGSYTGTLNEMKELVAFASQHDLVDIPVEVRPLEKAESAVDDLSAGNVPGRIILQNS
ncbi:alcohol dehydrogenase catalytic domain-containing protein [Marinobacter salinexigens]|uniref:alcohol dehydrogenase n=1 Tax=Marinobacter salinexigens TaxID=2919747 RepID=A0A5B0VCB8_9GAMM|nr:alcohol dehydrogenase [Marinobacter salinexigens]KAA1172316.1 alcohol dehydrogenase catalytic domain-containing protein [Marinobacter salinexigens]